ncbi:MAG: ABC transporter permease [Candidatus Thermoplasmatota archaeon]|nr:ABC transporter permease [Candidatus Thermoplasmatota archaeon]
MAMKENLRTLLGAGWLGWQMEANWTDPFLFLVYSVAKPVSGALILVFMYIVILGGVAAQSTAFAYIFLGNAFFIYVGQVLFGVTWVIHEDREHFQTLKLIYISPISFYYYIIGRAGSKILIATIAVVVTLLFGVFALGIPVDAFTMDWGLLILCLTVGMACLVSIGIALAGITFLTAKHSGGINEGIAGLFYVFCGVVFPITQLPAWGQSLGYAIPVTYWLEAMRKALLPAQQLQGTGLHGIENFWLVALLAVSALFFYFLSILIFRLGDYLARRAGKIDMTTAY